MTKKYAVFTTENHLINSSRGFDKSIRKVGNDITDRIMETVKKIGTGLGFEHELKGNYQGKRSIYVSKGGRIIFETKDNNEISLLKYDPSHAYR